MSYVSDLISTSAPGAAATHRIQFTTAGAIPASGTITLTPQSGAFELPAGFDYTDVDLAVWDGSSYVNRDLAAVPSATEDGVDVTVGSSSSITITLSSSAGIAAGDRVQILLGTSASFGAAGSVSPINPIPNISYRTTIETASGGGAPIDIAWTMIAVVLPVMLSVPLQNIAPTPFGGLPSGTLTANNPTIEIIVSTDRTASCRYSTVANTPYASMTDDFSPPVGIFFYAVVGGHQNGTTYTYYVKCKGVQNAVSDDYPITFSLAPTPISNTSVTESGGSSGSGDFTNGSSVLYQATVMLSGWATPGSTVAVLKDGKPALTSQASSAGVFQTVVNGLERGTYTFSIYSVDAKGRKSASYSSTLAVGAATNNIISGILLPPSLALEKDSVNVGEKVNISGSAAPNAAIDISVVPQSGGSASARQYAASTTIAGDWSLSIAGSDFQRGTYGIKARVSLGEAQSDYGTPAFLGVGQAVTKNLSNKSDINGDGKVNLVDFSIMLSFWNTNNDPADINSDGTVNLADFSILLFNWTG